MTRRLANGRRDSGQVTIFFAIVAFAWVAMFAMVIVGGGRNRAYQRADNYATEAARIAGQAIDPTVAIPGGPKLVKASDASAAATNYLNAVGATGTVVVDPSRQKLTIIVRITYDNPLGIDFIGGTRWHATGTATATLLIG